MWKKEDSIFSEDPSLIMERELKNIKFPKEETECENTDEPVIWLDDADEEDIELLKKEGIL